MIADIHQRFPPEALLQPLSIIYPHYWAEDDDDGSISEHFEASIADITKVYCASHDVGEIQTPGLLDKTQLEAEARKFEEIARSFAPRALNTEGTDTERTRRLWRLLSAQPHICEAIPQFFKLAKIVLVMVSGSVEDERGFSASSFVKSDDRNRLDVHVELCMRMKLQKLFTL